MSSWRDFLHTLPAKCADAKTANSAETVHSDPFGTIGTIGIETFTTETANTRSVENVLPGVPDEWCEGVRLICEGPAPATIRDDRWAGFGLSCRRLLVGHGPALQAAGWNSLDLFGLHPTAPEAAPDCWGVAWLLREMAVGAITAETVSLVASNGVTTRARKMACQARVKAVVAWELRHQQSGKGIL